MNQASTSLWQTIEMLAAQVPFSAAKIERIVPTRLVETEASIGRSSRFLGGTPVRLADGVEFSRIDLRLRREGTHPGFLVLDLQGRCVPLDEVRQHYADLRITGTPGGHSRDEATSYSAVLGWGALSFGFLERNPECLGYVAFDPA